MNNKPIFAVCLLLAAITASNFPVSPATAATDLPVYPAAKTQAIPSGHSITSRCGHTFTTMKSMTVGADPHAVAKWYQRKMPGSRLIDLSRAAAEAEGGGSNQTTTVEVFSADGSQTVVAQRFQFGGALTNASKSLGMDKTPIAVESISPPLDPRYIALTAQYAAGGAAGKRAEQQMTGSCKP
jgi:hypothetical protein